MDNVFKELINLNRFKKELKFVHITKTGGTTIEELGFKNNIRWGIYHNEYKNHHKPLNEQKKELIEKYDWFMVVRNPYDRIISELHCKWGNRKKNEILNKSKEEINEYIRDCIIYRDINNKNKYYCYGHYKEQYKYLCNNTNMNIIKFENFKEEFDLLMVKYNIDLKLDIHLNKNNKIFTVNDLDKHTIDIINHIYNKDFELFNYKKI